MVSGLEGLLGEVRGAQLAVAALAWPALASELDARLPDAADPLALLPVAAGLACGAAPAELVDVAGAVLAMALGLRVLDDCADDDDPHALHVSLGLGRAIHVAAALGPAVLRALRALPLAASESEALAGDYLDAYARVCRGQDAELRDPPRTIGAYRRVVEDKTVAPYAFAALAGARTAGAGADALARARRCGEQVGWMIQILDDLEALWFPDGPSDLARGRLTFPVLYGQTLPDPRARELRRLCGAPCPDEARALELLDALGVRMELMRRALDHRDAALAALGSPLAPAGRAVLTIWLDWLLGDGARLAGNAA